VVWLFSALLFGGLRESQQDCSVIELKDTPAAGFHHLLKYIYTGRIYLSDLRVSCSLTPLLLFILSFCCCVQCLDWASISSDFQHIDCLTYVTAWLHQVLYHIKTWLKNFDNRPRCSDDAVQMTSLSQSLHLTVHICTVLFTYLLLLLRVLLAVEK